VLSNKNLNQVRSQRTLIAGECIPQVNAAEPCMSTADDYSGTSSIASLLTACLQDPCKLQSHPGLPPGGRALGGSHCWLQCRSSGRLSPSRSLDSASPSPSRPSRSLDSASCAAWPRLLAAGRGVQLRHDQQAQQHAQRVGRQALMRRHLSVQQQRACVALVPRDLRAQGYGFGA
jgi:hypothetical protein